MTQDAQPKPKTKHELDPDHYRMTIGEHLEELRVRLILGLAGFAVALVFCLIFGKQVMLIFLKPLWTIFLEYDISTQVFYTQVSDTFMVYIKISLISAAALASPWILYQFWLFIAAGLYAHEREVVTKYVPLSLTLLITGMLFVYYLVLPWTLKFFLAFSISIPFPQPDSPTTQPTTMTSASTQPVIIPLLHGDPEDKVEGQLWMDEIAGRLKMFHKGKVRVISFGPESMTAPMITLPGYISLVFGMLLTFGLSFQMPLAVMALVTVGIVERQSLRESRQYVYFAMAIVAAIITPGDVITATVALMVPLCLLFELGIWLSKDPATTTDEADSGR